MMTFFAIWAAIVIVVLMLKVDSLSRRVKKLEQERFSQEMRVKWGAPPKSDRPNPAS